MLSVSRGVQTIKIESRTFRHCDGRTKANDVFLRGNTHLTDDYNSQLIKNISAIFFTISQSKVFPNYFLSVPSFFKAEKCGIRSSYFRGGRIQNKISHPLHEWPAPGDIVLNASEKYKKSSQKHKKKFIALLPFECNNNFILCKVPFSILAILVTGDPFPRLTQPPLAIHRRDLQEQYLTSEIMNLKMLVNRLKYL